MLFSFFTHTAQLRTSYMRNNDLFSFGPLNQIILKCELILKPNNLFFQVDGHSIPSDAIIIAQIHNVMKRGEIFEKAEEFRPERFLMEDGKTPNRVSFLDFFHFSFIKNVVPE